MSIQVLRKTIERVLTSGLVDAHLNIGWHAGEPLTLPIEYYENAFAVIGEMMPRDVLVEHTIHTNATHITEEWADFFERHSVRVGVSLDGPAWVHDGHRRDKQGDGSHERVMRGVNVLKSRSTPFNVIAIITSSALAEPDAVFEFFAQLSPKQMSFTFEEIKSANVNSSLLGESQVRCKAFLERIYELNGAAGRPLKIRQFENAYQAILGADLIKRAPFQQTRPLAIVSIDSDGNISTFSEELLGERFVFGNVMQDELLAVLSNEQFVRLNNEIAEGIGMCARACEYFTFCGGGLPANKLFENGTCASTETLHCRNAIQTPIDIVLAGLEREVNPAARVS